jgi:hypothetical protein
MVAAAVVGAAVIGGVASNMAASEQAEGAAAAGDASAAATFASVREQRRQYDTTRQDFQPYRSVGVGALGKLADLYGISGWRQLEGGEVSEAMSQLEGKGAGIYEVGGNRYNLQDIDGQISGVQRYYDASTADRDAAYDEFRSSPDYQFAFDEGINALDRSAAARGGLRGGGYARELTRYGQGMASQQFNTYANRLSSLAGIGQAATGSVAAAGAQSASGISNSLMMGGQMQGNALQNAATARASGYAGIGNAATGAANNYMLYSALQA